MKTNIVAGLLAIAFTGCAVGQDQVKDSPIRADALAKAKYSYAQAITGTHTSASTSTKQTTKFFREYPTSGNRQVCADLKKTLNEMERGRLRPADISSNAQELQGISNLNWCGFGQVIDNLSR